MPSTVSVECWRVPPEGRVAGAVTVPCLGGLDTGWLVAAHRVAADGPVLYDRELCQGCPSGDGAHCPVQRVLDEARGLLEYMGVPPGRLPRRFEQPLPDGVAVGASKGPDGEVTLSRRGFLGQLGRRSGRAAVALCLPMGMDDATATTKADRLARPPHASHSRQRLLNACLDLVRHDGYRLPRPLLHSVGIGPDRCDTGLCRAVCPTGALRHAITGDQSRHLFSALRCIGCRACERACPHDAFRLDDCMDDGWHRTQVVASHRARECAHCGAAFTASDESTTCDACSKSRALARSLFRQLSGGNSSNTKVEYEPAGGSD